MAISPRNNPGGISESAIRRQLLRDALQHPATLLPLAVCVAAGVWLLALSSLFGGGRVVVALLGGAGLAAAAGFVWRYVICYSDAYARIARELLDLLELEEAQLKGKDVGRLREALQAGFLAVSSEQGLKALRELAYEYEELLPVLEERRDSNPLTMSGVPNLAAETYRQGLGVLSDALGVMKATDAPGRARLESETAELQREIEALYGVEGQAERLRLKEETLISHRERLRMLDGIQLRVEQLLFQAGQCEAALHRTRIEMTAIKAGSSESRVDSVTEALRRTISRVKEVQDEMRKLGY